ncbi:MAG: hypothetical protein L0H74_00720 [Brachybacterium sp.]|nr:hypothetical protein [Brachybacterium sp.]
MTWKAFIDESEPHGRSPGTYLLAAALIQTDELENVRGAVAPFLRPGQKKIHWHDENSRSRRDLVAAVAQLEAIHLVVVRDGAEPTEKSERRRRKCLERLLWSLDANYGVNWATIEARQQRQNESDRYIHNRMRARQEISSTLRMDHTPGPKEPLLWVADIVAGAFIAHRCGDEVGYAALDDLVDIEEIQA